ncbi:transglycosylase SLT domain-containing protein [Kitasatospora purpeofusca]|uniref:transglycosylase SLT domain-containing protein n=1 Tax=Kitasatospora purpeofusca TaxID=67352 RepID=UPI00225196DD|nr:transglycosylase SLT domain-containing protein [Kitasatospora purpeofusca]MCX4685473.1 transglycosylase SLT domain-containing protein [Kitasatospora purpeofusca]
MAPSTRGPIKVGSGYIEIHTDLSRESLNRFKADLTRQMEKAGAEAGKALSTAATRGFEALPKAAATAAKKASAVVESEGKDSAETLARIERDLTRQFGTEAARRFTEARRLEQQKQTLAEETSAVTQRALRAAVAQETEAATARSRLTQQQERERVTSLRRQAEEAARAAREEQLLRQRNLEDEVRVDREIEAARLRVERETQAAIRETALVRQAAHRDALRDQIAQNTAVRDGLRQQLAETRTIMSQVSSTHTSALTRMQGGWKKLTEGTEKFGTSITETGNLLVNKIVAPLSLAAGAATAIGVKSADAMISSQTGLSGMGIQLKDVNSLLEQMTSFGVETPYSINDMLKYGTRYARANAAHNYDFNSSDPEKKAKGSAEVAQRSVDMVRMIGDSAAYGGVLDPVMVSQGMYALEVIQDMGRTPLRNLKQLERAIGLPGQQIAHLVGFKDRAFTPEEMKAREKMAKDSGAILDQPKTYEASAQLYAFMADAKNTGGLTGEQLIQKLLEHWKNEPNLTGAAKRMGGATISGRLENMKENAQFRLGKLFYSEGEDGSYNYTGLGSKIMGHKVTDEKGVTTYEGGLLNDVQDIGKSVFPTLKLMLEKFIGALSKLTEWVKKAADYLEEHPGLRDLLVKAAQLAAVLGPAAIVVGTLAKLLGKAGKLAGTAAGLVTAPVMAAGRGARGATRVARQARAGFASRGEGDGFLRGYRNRRIELTGGTRGDERRTRNEIRDLEAQIRSADAQTAELRRDLQAVNSTQLRAIIQELSGGGRSVENAAESARTEVHQIQTQGVEPLNRASLSGLQAEIGDTEQRVERLAAALRDAQREVTQLDGKKLVAFKVTVDSAHGAVSDLREKIEDTSRSMTQLDGKKLVGLKVTVDSAHGAVGDLKDKVDNTGTSVNQLDARNLNRVKAEFNQLHNAADQVYEKVGMGTGAMSVAGRVGLLDQRSLSALRSEFSLLHGSADTVYEKVGQGTGATSLAGRIGLLNQRSLGSLKNEFDGVYNSADSVFSKVGQGTGAESLAGRIGLLNGRSLKDIKEQVEKLSTALSTAHGHAKNLDDSIDNITKKAPGGSSGGSPTKPDNKKKYATGGILPGYAPGVDSIPAILSPGEAILRPEVTAALGPALIHGWNAAARKGQLSRYAGGGIAGRIGFNEITDAIRLQNLWPYATGAANVMTFARSSDDIGGDTRAGMLGVGTNTSRWIGSGVADRFKGMFDFVTDDSWKLLRRVPTVLGQVAGIAGGTLAPILGDYFWDDVWKGNGNIVDRGGKFLSDTFSVETLKRAGTNLVGGLWESVKSLVGGAKDLITDPVGSVKDAFSAVWDMASAETDQVVDMVKAIKQIYDAPGEYAGSVLMDVLSTAQEAMPNTEGLFDFDNDAKVSSGGIPKEAFAFTDMLGGKLDPTGDQVTRWRPTVQRVLGELGVSQDYTDLILHRIKVESGGDPNAVNNWDSNALNPNIGASAGLMQTIPATFAAYAGPYQYLGRMNGLASIYAGLNYAMNRYGAGWPQALAGNSGYWSGTLSASPGMRLVGEHGPELVDFRGGERVHDAPATRRMLQGKTYEIHVHEAKSEDTTQAVLRAMQYAEVMSAM